jgi:hypothetical protein
MFNFPSQEELEKHARDAHAARVADRANPSDETVRMQTLTSLRHWLDACIKAGIPHVPATWSPTINEEDVFAALDGKPAETVQVANEWLAEHLTPGQMWRWDFCSPLNLKYDMSESGKPRPIEYKSLDLDDPKFCDLLTEINRGVTWACVRPWTAAAYVGSHPVEFRVYTFKDAEPAVCNYYPQRDLPPEWKAKAKEAVTLAKKLVSFMPYPDFTADFLVKENGDLVFLEGGPEWTSGRAHPCCFKPEDLIPGAIALKNENPELSE